MNKKIILSTSIISIVFVVAILFAYVYGLSRGLTEVKQATLMVVYQHLSTLKETKTKREREFILRHIRLGLNKYRDIDLLQKAVKSPILTTKSWMDGNIHVYKLIGRDDGTLSVMQAVQICNKKTNKDERERYCTFMINEDGSINKNHKKYLGSEQKPQTELINQFLPAASSLRFR